MSQEPAPNFHSTEEAVVLGVDTSTTSAFDAIERELGSASKDTFAKLDTALLGVVKNLTKIKNDIGDKKKSLAKNRELVDYSVIKIPTPVVPSISEASKTINQVIGNHTSPDIQALHTSISIAQMVRVPAEVTNFEKKKIALVAAKLDALLSEVSSAQDIPNAIQQVIAPKL